MTARPLHTARTPGTPGKPHSAWHALQTRLAPLWQRLNARERRAVVAAAGVCAAAALWWGALAPALTTLRQAPARHAELDAQLGRMRTQAEVATRLQAQPVLGHTERMAALQADTRRLLGDTATVRISADQATVTLKATSPEALAQWLADVRANARLTPTEARLTALAAPPGNPTSPATPGTPSPNGPPNPSSPTPPRWQGEVTFALGAANGR